ncbi:circumsporozoite protein-like [Macrobrachium rosenbergii]|uniref:circumsporozoite protein-like n=1 Tax=Macrobrachium rosenbergii TaxID=79674 RepID=UPI0034D53BFE
MPARALAHRAAHSERDLQLILPFLGPAAVVGALCAVELQWNPSKWTQVAVFGLASTVTGSVLNNIKTHKPDDDDYKGKIQALEGEVRLEREERKNLTLLNADLTERVHCLENAFQENREEKEKEELQRKDLGKKGGVAEKRPGKRNGGVAEKGPGKRKGEVAEKGPGKRKGGVAEKGPGKRNGGVAEKGPGKRNGGVAEKGPGKRKKS